MLRLNSSNLASIASKVQIPTYNRDIIPGNIAHLGVGNFHRAHQAYYTDRLLSLRSDTNWGITGVEMRDNKTLRKGLPEQDGLYTLTTWDPQGTGETKIVGSIVNYIDAVGDISKAITTLSSSATRIISLTVTEMGYPRVGSCLDKTHPDVRWDISHPSSPRTALGVVSAALKQRSVHKVAPVTVMCCDNLPCNGDLTKSLLQEYAAEDQELTDYIQACSFPNSMVDRITPASPNELQQYIETLGIDDEVPVVAEDFIQWVLEDNFVSGRPAWELAGVTMVDDCMPYELMKLRLLNGAHLALTYPASLLGHRMVDVAMQDEDLRNFTLGYMNEVTPTLNPIVGVDYDTYKSKLIQRFSNPVIGDQIARLRTDGSAKPAVYLVPQLTELVQDQKPIDHIALVLAAWIRASPGVDDEGIEFDIADALAPELKSAANNILASADPDVSLFLHLVLGEELSRNDVILQQVKKYLALIKTRGIREMLKVLNNTSN